MGIAFSVPISAAEETSESPPEEVVETNNNVAGSDISWVSVKVKMAVPSGVEIPNPVYVMYLGKDTDLFAELSKENGYETDVKAVPGTYDIYQVVPTFPTDLTFMATSQFIADNNNPVINIYIRDAEGLINADITEGDVPVDLAQYGEAVSEQAEAEQAKKQQEIQEQQAEAANATYEGEGVLSVQPEQQNPGGSLPGDNTRQTKITGVTATNDAVAGVTGLMIIGAVIVGVGILIIIFVLMRKYNSISKGDKDENNGRPQNGNSISNR